MSNCEDQYKHETGRTANLEFCLGCGGFDKDYIAWIESKLDHYKRLAEAADEYIKHLEKVVSSEPIQLGNSIYLSQLNHKYQSIKQECGK